MKIVKFIILVEVIDQEFLVTQGNRTIKTYQTTTVREKTYFAKPAFYNV